MNDFKIRLLGKSILNKTITTNSYILISDDIVNSKYSGTPVYRTGSGANLRYYYSPTFTGTAVSNNNLVGIASSKELIDSPGYLKNFSYDFINALLLDKPDNPTTRDLYTLPLDIAFAPLGAVASSGNAMGSIANTFYGDNWDGVSNYGLLPKINEGNIPYLHAELIQHGMLPLSVVPPVAIQNIKIVQSVPAMLAITGSEVSLGDSVQVVMADDDRESFTYNITKIDTTSSNKASGTRCYKNANGKFYYTASGTTQPVNLEFTEGNGIWKTTSGDIFLVINKSKSGTFDGTVYDYNSYNAGAATKLATTTVFDIVSSDVGGGSASNYTPSNTNVGEVPYNGTQETRTLTIKKLDSYLIKGKLDTTNLQVADITAYSGAANNNNNWSTITNSTRLNTILQQLNTNLCTVANTFSQTNGTEDITSVYIEKGTRFITQGGLWQLLRNPKEVKLGPANGTTIKVISPQTTLLVSLGSESSSFKDGYFQNLKIVNIDTTNITVSNLFKTNKLEVTGTASFDSLSVTNGITCLSVTTTSARKAKKDIMKVTDSIMPLINSIDVVTYKYIADAKGIPHIGFIADDTDPLLSGPNRDSMSVSDCIGAILKAVQELDNRLTKLENAPLGGGK